MLNEIELVKTVGSSSRFTTEYQFSTESIGLARCKKAMEKITTNVILLMWILWTCSNVNGFRCECNIIDACDAQGNPRPNPAQYLPSGVDNFGFAPQGRRNVMLLCEGDTVLILYDLNSRIPLYSATVMTGQQLSAGSLSRPNYFRQSSEVRPEYQQNGADYEKSSKRDLCFEKGETKTRAVDKKWASSAKKGPLNDNVCLTPELVKAVIHKGHLIASQYGRGNKERMLATFTFTNIVPQFGDFNSVPWQQCERSLIEWGKRNCAKGTHNVKLFIVVGAIPSTYPVSGPSEPRFFGRKGFSDYQDDNYRVNVPSQLWTAACCTFEYQDDQGHLQTGARSTAFWRENVPGVSPCNMINILAMATSGINVFPRTPQCRDNCIPLNH